jgi:hypothetical protein
MQNKKTLYIAGPMSGLPGYNAAAFDAAAVDLRQRGYRVINPVELDLEVGFDPSTDSPEDFDLPAAIRRDVVALIECDAIVMLPGHETSKGATAERHVAIWRGLEVLSYPSMVALDDVETASCPESTSEFVSIEGVPIKYDSTIGETFIGPLPRVHMERSNQPIEIVNTWSKDWGRVIDGGDDGGFMPIGHEKLTETLTGSPTGKLWIPEAESLKDGDTVTNERGGKQSHLSARFDCIPPEVLKLLAQCLGFGAAKYGSENWKSIDLEDNLAHAMNHINEYRLGDRSEPHLVNTMARVTFALWQAVEKGDQPTTYIHPDMQAAK